MEFKVKLKKIKIGVHSEETLDFIADVWINGKCVGTAENRGHGGNTNWQPYGISVAERTKNLSVMEAADNYFKSLPPIKHDNFDIKRSLEWEIDEIANKYDEEKQLEKLKKKMAKIMIPETIVTGWPFVGHVDQSARPTLEAKSFLEKAYQRFYTNNDNLIRHGYYKLMGYRYDFRPFLKKYLYKQYGQWTEAFAPNKTTLRQVIYGKIDKIIEIK